MGIKSADASLFQTAVLSAAKNLEAKKEWTPCRFGYL